MISVVTHWFKKKRGFALGLTSFGSALGATVQPIILRQLITKIGCVQAISRPSFGLKAFHNKFQVPMGNAHPGIYTSFRASHREFGSSSKIGFLVFQI
jgi:hypothetical protein